jgi:hypothetical protein
MRKKARHLSRCHACLSVLDLFGYRIYQDFELVGAGHVSSAMFSIVCPRLRASTRSESCHLLSTVMTTHAAGPLWSNANPSLPFASLTRVP